MKFAIVAEVLIVALAGILMFAATTASAEPSSRACWSMASTVKAALDAHPDASQTARDEYQAGTEACTKGYTKLGISHLQAALKAVGG